MATGEVTTSTEGSRDLEVGEVLMGSGRVSVARRVEPERPRLPFGPTQLARLDEALALSSRSTGLEFAIYLGELTEQTRQRAEELHGVLGDRASAGVLIAVSPGQGHAEIVTGEQAYRRIPDRSCQLAMMSMVASFKEGELIDGLVSALRMLSDTAGTRSSDGQAGH